MRISPTDYERRMAWLDKVEQEVLPIISMDDDEYTAYVYALIDDAPPHSIGAYDE